MGGTFRFSAANDCSELIVLKNSMPLYLPQNLRTNSFQLGTQKIMFEKVRFGGKMFPQFGLIGSDTKFFNTISPKPTPSGHPQADA